MALGCSVPKAIRFVDLNIACDGFDLPAVPCRPWLSRQATGSTSVSVGICRVAAKEGLPHPLTLSQSSRSGL